MTATLAIVDDDAAFTEYMGVLLRHRGYQVSVFNSGAPLLDALRSGTAPSVILLDVSMPGMDGLETLRSIKAAQPLAQVIMLSGGQAPATIVEAVRLGAADYVLKPGDADGLGEAALEAAIRNALERESLASENVRLRTQLAEDPEGVQPCWSSGDAMQAVMIMVERIADSDVGVLIRGESGVGKEVIAREIHRRSARRARPFVKVNCAALPTDLLESELFGHERGAFTGAATQRIGKFEFAQQGTIMLDEIGEVPASIQAKLLHVLQDGVFTRLGSNRPVEVEVRILAATNRDLEAMMKAGTFREDLYYRLQVIELRVPPLRDRRAEIPPLVEFFLSKYAALYRRPATRPGARLLAALSEHRWPGNVRELENTIKRYVVLQEDQLILTELDRLRQRDDDASVFTAPVAPASVTGEAMRSAAPAPYASKATEHAPEPVDDDAGVDLPGIAKAAAMNAERTAIQQALNRFRWNRRKAADYLNVSYKTLLNKMKECGITELPSS